jgi:hypothetical protein
MNAKSGKTGSPVTPTAPDEAEDADVADPVEAEKTKAEQIQQNKGKYGATPVTPHNPPTNTKEASNKTTWIEIELVDEGNKPVPGEKYKITLPDNSVAGGTLDEKGFARIEGIVPGTCKITFPNLEKDAWGPA